ncbi:DUF1553 domain-containing protein [Planctomycetota bacterium]
MSRILHIFLCPLIAIACVCQTLASEIEFNRDIRPILSDACFQCHGPDENHREADLRFDDQESVLEDRGDYAAIVPGSREKSELWVRIQTTDPDLQMPPADHLSQLSSEQKELLGKWIDEGAQFQGHWSFVKPRRPTLPDVDNKRFNQNAIDRFVAAVMSDKGLSPNEQAAKEILLRRVTFDLTGLPPTIEHVEAFASDESADAYDKAVDRLLESQHFGERMALDWMDAARYGDSSVFHADGPRHMWVWREWVIDAFNANMPFDQFTIEQLAGDLLPDPTWRQLAATGFNRNNATTDEGGLIEEEYRVEYAIDRVKTTSLVWLGLSMECAQCHEHKYDPISQEDYYRFFAFFNQAADPGRQTRNGNQPPIVDIPDEDKIAKVPELEKTLAKYKKELESSRAQAEPEFTAWVAEQSNNAKPPAAPSGAIAHFELDAVDNGNCKSRVGEQFVATIDGSDATKESPIGEGRVVNSLNTNANLFTKTEGLADFEHDQSFSYGCWVKAPKVEGAPIARMNSEKASRGFDLHLNQKSISAHFIHAWPNNAVKVEANAKLAPNEWHHVFVTYDGSSKASGVQLFLNGKKLKANAVTDKLSGSIKTDAPFTIGRRSSSSFFKGSVDDVRVYDRVLTNDEVKQLADLDPIQSLLAFADRTDDHTNRLREHFLNEVHESYKSTTKNVAATETMITMYRKPRSTVMIMKNLPQMRPTYVLNRGQYDAPDKERPVLPGVPSFFSKLETDKTATRLDLARWIVNRDNPLTARVIVNRYWRLLMGKGIVTTVEDLGSQGDWPTHPRLLDWLAVDFMENGWDVKRLVKQIVTSETYRQAARSTTEQLAVDPENRYLSHGPRFRLQGEFIRDNALAVSGLLVSKIGGPSVKPYQPPGIWNEVSLNGNLRFKQDSGEGLYRRSMYTYWKRSAPSPSMTIFDAPTREKCTVRRSTTNTPLQALVVMNDPQFVEAARFMAERVMKQTDSPAERIDIAYRLATARKPSTKIRSVLHRAFATELKAFQADSKRAQELLDSGDGKRDESLDLSEHAAWTVVCSIILNLDETLTRG